ncbi:MAG: formate dehydrogenase accessory sulfurtransferase FdhD [Betaproteobacteria bacterium]|nr:formate dehydrogenase accessory sulfurtransferase FdhD [Betaproteobacteria bacterium]
MRPAVARRHHGGRSFDEHGWVVEEAPLFIDIVGAGSYTLMRTAAQGAEEACAYTVADGVLAEAGVPDSLALAAGFLLSEGIVADFGEVQSMALCADTPEHLRVELFDPSRAPRGGRLVASACGLCGESTGQHPAAGLPQVGRALHLVLADLPRLMTEMERRQPIFRATGGSHSAGLFDASAHLVAVAEDLGRHNALDKVIGEAVLTGRLRPGCGVLLSGRVSLELVAKAARAGVELISAISAPTSLAIDTAERCGISLCGFVRQGRATVYTHSERLVG